MLRPQPPHRPLKEEGPSRASSPPLGLSERPAVGSPGVQHQHPANMLTSVACNDTKYIFKGNIYQRRTSLLNTPWLPCLSSSSAQPWHNPFPSPLEQVRLAPSCPQAITVTSHSNASTRWSGDRNFSELTSIPINHTHVDKTHLHLQPAQDSEAHGPYEAGWQKREWRGRRHAPTPA